MDEGGGGGFHDDEGLRKNGRHRGVWGGNKNGKPKVRLGRIKKGEKKEKKVKEIWHKRT